MAVVESDQSLIMMIAVQMKLVALVLMEEEVVKDIVVEVEVLILEVVVVLAEIYTYNEDEVGIVEVGDIVAVSVAILENPKMVTAVIVAV